MRSHNRSNHDRRWRKVTGLDIRIGEDKKKPFCEVSFFSVQLPFP